MSDGQVNTFTNATPAAERNKMPIWHVLETILPKKGEILEIASGSGVHMATFAQFAPDIIWQPSDYHADSVRQMLADFGQLGLNNIKNPVRLDVCENIWPVENADGIICINMVHIAPWQASIALFKGAGRILKKGQWLYLYGPFFQKGESPAQGNMDFDQSLRERNSDWGIRDIEDMDKLAQENGFKRQSTIAMPANNLSLIYSNY